MGKWLNRDPLGETGGINLYGFVLNNPINLIDPDGRVFAGSVIATVYYVAIPLAYRYGPRLARLARNAFYLYLQYAPGLQRMGMKIYDLLHPAKEDYWTLVEHYTGKLLEMKKEIACEIEEE